jgi:hypothetical protein
MLNKFKLVIGGPAVTLYLLVLEAFMMVLGYAAAG